jgi:hypothetical protein
MERQVEDDEDNTAIEEAWIDCKSYLAVLGILPMFKNERARIVQLIEDRRDRFGAPMGHEAGFSTKCHCECAGHAWCGVWQWKKQMVL